MATTAGGRSSGRPAISIAEPRRAWGKDTPQAAPLQDEKSEGGDPRLKALPVGETAPQADTEDQPSAAQQLAALSPLDTTSIGSTSPPPGTLHGPTAAATGTCLSQSSPVGQNDSVFPRAPIVDAATLENLQVRSIGVPQGAQEKRGVLVSPLIPTANATELKETPQDPRTAVSGAAAAVRLVAVVAQETHIAPVVQLSLGQGARYRVDRAPVAKQGAVPEQGTQPSDSELLAARVDVLAAGKPLRPSPEQLASVARSSSEQGAASSADGELNSSTAPVDYSVSGLANELPHAVGVVPLPSHQVATQIVATALAVQREAAQPIDTLAAKSLSPSVVKVLRLELQPEDLGTITIRMSLKQDALDIRVEASRYDTACLLQRDQGSLAKILTSAGYRIDGMAVVAAATDGAAVPDGRSQAFLPSSTPQHWGSSQPDSRSSGGRPNAEPDPRTSHGKQNDDNDKSRIGRGAGSDLYV
jgi:flagellar hook-length control protein FliK